MVDDIRKLIYQSRRISSFALIYDLTFSKVVLMNSLRVDFGVEKCMDKVFKLGQMVHDMRKINQTPLKFIFVMSCVQFDST